MVDKPEPPDLEVSIPLPDGLWVTGEEPYRILVVGDFADSDRGTLSGPLQDGVVSVTPETFDEVMAAAAPSVSYTTTDPLASGGGMVEVSLRFDSLRAFMPEALLRQLPATRSLREVRERIVARLRGQASAAELAGAVGRVAASETGMAWLVEALKPSAEPPPANTGAVDALLDQLDLGEGTSAAPRRTGKTPVGALISAAAGAGAGLPAGEAAALRRTLAEIDRRLAVWLTAVMHSPPVQQVESAWRGLAFLISRVDFRKGVRVSVLHATRDALLERFTSRVIDPVFDEGAEAPDLIAVDMLFGNTAADLETLDGLAQHAASLPAIVLAGVSPDFFGVKHAWQVATLPPLVNTFDQWQFAKWKTLRGQPYAQHLGVIFGRCLLRAPNPEERRSEFDFVYQEPCAAEKDLVWTSGPVAAVGLVAHSVAATGWPAGVIGLVRGRIEGLPVVHAEKKGEKPFGPADTQIPQPKVQELGLVGVNTITGLRDADDAVLWNGMTVARPRRADPNALLEVSLPYMLFAGRLSALLWALKPHLAGSPAEKVCASVMAHVGTWLKLLGGAVSDAVTVQVRAADDDPKALQLALTVVPPQTLVPGAVPVVLGYKLTPN